MPLSVRVAIAAAGLVGVVGALSAAVWAADAWAGGAGTRWLSALPVVAAALERGGSPVLLLFLGAIPIALRRDARLAQLVVQLALFAAISLGVMGLGIVGPGPAGLRLDAGRAGLLVVVGLVAVLAGALSRPSAKAWFAATPR